MADTAELNSLQPLLVRLLLEKEILAPEHIPDLDEARSKLPGALERILGANGPVMGQHIAEVYADYLMVPLFEMAPDVADPRLASLLPEKLCREHLFVPVELHEDTLDVAFATFEGMLTVDELQLLAGLTIRPMMAPLLVVEKTLDTLYRGSHTKFVAEGGECAATDESDTGQQNEEILNIDQAPPPGPDSRIVRLGNQILEQALYERASDIHLEPFEDFCSVRVRVDGSLCPMAPPPRSQFLSVVSRLKILAKMDIAEKRLPQDGAIALRASGKRIDLRVSTVPTVYGEKMVIRILDKGGHPHRIDRLGI